MINPDIRALCECISDIDFIFVRENTEGLYKGIEFMLNDSAVCLRVITSKCCERIAKKAFEIAKRRKNGKVTAIHKENVMKSILALTYAIEDIARGEPIRPAVIDYLQKVRDYVQETIE